MPTSRARDWHQRPALATGVRHDLDIQGSNPIYVRTGHLLFQQQESVFAVPFDPRKRCVLYNFSIKSHKQIGNLKEFIGCAFNVGKHSFDLVLI